MKNLSLLLPVFFAALLFSSTMAAPSPDLSASHPRTETALACLLGLEPDGCESAFRNPKGAAWRTTYCTEEYIHRSMDNCRDGRLESVDYLGANAAGADVYEVRYLNSDMTYILDPPGADGKIGRLLIIRGTPSHIVPASLVQVTPETATRLNLYKAPN